MGDNDDINTLSQEAAQSGDLIPPELRVVSTQELAKLLDMHRQWVLSSESQGARGDLSGMDLRHCDLTHAELTKVIATNAHFDEANLSGANLEDTILHGVSLRGAGLREARLVRACLENADLRGAQLHNASLQDARMPGVKLRDADLQGADLKGVQGLLKSDLGGANLSGAKLPGALQDFPGLAGVEEISRNARPVFFSMLLACLYAWLTIATTTDAHLITNSVTSPLPIIGTEIRIAWFYWAAPFILVMLYLYLHLYLMRLWSAMATLPAQFPDGRRLDECAYPWLLTGLVRRHFALLRSACSSMTKLEEWLTIFLAWWAVPITLLGLWLRFLPVHEWSGTWLHIALLVVTYIAALITYRTAVSTLRAEAPMQWKQLWREKLGYQSLTIAMFAMSLWFLSYGAIERTKDTDVRFADVRTWIHLMFEQLGYCTGADLREEQLSTKPADYWELSDARQIESVKRARLRGKDLRYADAVEAFLVRADLREAKLEGIALRRADLTSADFWRADLRGQTWGKPGQPGPTLVKRFLQTLASRKPTSGMPTSKMPTLRVPIYVVPIYRTLKT